MQKDQKDIEHKMQRKLKKPKISTILKVLAVFSLLLVCIITRKTKYLKFYPVVICSLMFFVFFSSLLNKKNNSLIFDFACLADETLKTSTTRTLVKRYCKKVCVVWCAFFVFNGSVALWTALFANTKIWAVYNGCISYILMGLVFSIEFIARKEAKKNMTKFFPISDFDFSSHENEHVLCFEGKYSNKIYKTWGDFLEDTARLRAFLNAKPFSKWLLHSEDRYYFLVCFVSLLQCKKEVMLTANTTKGYIDQLEKEDIGFLTDLPVENRHFDIATVLQNSSLEEPKKDPANCPKIVAEETKIHLFTSGSTGEPKDVLQRLTEFQNDNAFILSKWADEILKRKIVSVVSCHHIYGLLFSVMLPFAAGIPFARKRIEYPQELEKLDDDSYLIVAVPAFLKRTVEIEEKLPLKNPFIFTSGGAVPFEVAKKTQQVFGFWPLEVYGSTETSGIAYRVSKSGPEWTLFDNAQIHLTNDGCLVIRSPYIKDPKGFETADLAQILEDGRFLLKGRADNVVKIEEKRISLFEVENILMKSGLIEDVCVIPLQNQRRQYLAAVVVLNDAGKKKFSCCQKFDMDKFFKEYLLGFFEPIVIPKRFRYLSDILVDAQGKHKRQQMQALFT